jgi:hypothetical protein
MKFTKILGLVAMAALALMAFASTATATTLYTNGEKKAVSVTIEATLKGSALLRDTSNVFANTCTSSTVKGHTVSPFTGTTVGGPIDSLSFSGCTHEKVVVDTLGTLNVEVIGSGPNGTVRSNGAKVTTPVTIFGSVVTATCTTENTDIGTLTGSESPWTGTPLSEIDINAVLNCGSILPSAKWEGTYLITGHNIAVTS